MADINATGLAAHSADEPSEHFHDEDMRRAWKEAVLVALDVEANPERTARQYARLIAWVQNRT